MIKNQNFNFSSLPVQLVELSSDLKGGVGKLHPYFVTGFSDAEANFYVRLSKKSTMKAGWIGRNQYLLFVYTIKI